MYFWKYDFCDVYVEACKPILTTEGVTEKHKDYDQTLNTLFWCIETGLRLLHPLMPFLTEELYCKLNDFENKPESLVIA